MAVSDIVFSKINPERDLAIQVQDVSLSYGGLGSSKTHVMKQLSMQVPRGYIYGLLGPSGCGKTSLIRCILGTLGINSGEINVFGGKPGESGSSIPGPGVGYMPQNITLYPDLTINESLFYFASLYGMKRGEIAQRSEFLISFLNLPDRNRMVAKLSGGQKRRVSLAVALIHKPPLLILDEPTVGVDPLLRKSIWEHLTKLSRSERLTVLITTHYIEEAKDANLVGFMRDGKILEQDNPNQLLTRYGLANLEQVFLHLCVAQDAAIQPVEVETQQNRIVTSNGFTTNNTNRSNQISQPNKPNPVSPFLQISTMIWRNLRTLIRSPGYLLFQFLLPMVEAILFCSALGRDLHSIPLAVYDGDQSNLSQSLLKELDPEMITQTFYHSEYDAIESVRDGATSTALVMHPNFSFCLLQRMMVIQNGNVSSEILANSTIHLFPDMSNQFMVQFVQREVLRSFSVVGKRTLEALGQSSSAAELPIQMNEAVYGKINGPYVEFMVPGAMLSIAFFAAISLTTMNLVVERIRGLIERTNVVGVSNFGILLSHIITYTLVLMVQVILLLVMILAVFKIPYNGSLLLVGGMTALHSICGMCMGLFISAVSNSENMATMLSLGIFYPTLLLSGTMWPLEGMNDVLRYFSYVLPETIPIRSMRYLMIRGWGLNHWDVIDGFLVNVGWIAVFLVLSIVAFKYQK